MKILPFTLPLVFLGASSAFAQPAPPEAPPPETPEAPAPPDAKPTPEAPPPEAPPEAPPEGEPTGDITKNPSLRADSPPVYPPLALEKRAEAVVVLELDIAADGTMDSVSLSSVAITMESGEPLADESVDEFGFGKAALIAGNLLEFDPAEVDGQPVAVRVNYTYRFTLPAKVEAPPAPETVTQAAPDNTGPAVINFQGVLLERGTRSLVSGVKLAVFRGEGDDAVGFEATTDSKGRFAFYDLAPGTWEIIAEHTGYIPYKTTETVVEGEAVSSTYYFEKGSYNPYDVTVEAERPRKEVTRRSLRGADIEKVPGTLGDPVLVVENLPGVARTLGGDIIVRGSGPRDTGVFVDGTRVPLIYHFGGLKSVFPAKIIESVDFYPGNFSAAYGRAMGGIFDLHLKRLEPDRFHGSIDVSVLDTSVYLEVPITDKLAVGIAGRRSYIDFILDAAIPEDSGIGLVSAPRYYDYQFFGNWRPAPSHDVRWLLLGSDDLFELLFEEPAEAVNAGATSNGVSLGTSFQRLTGDYRYTPNEKIKNHLKLAVGRDTFGLDVLGFLGAEFDVKSVSSRDTLTYRFSDHVKLDVGFDVEFFNMTGEVILPPPPREGEPQGDLDPDSIIQTEFDSENVFLAAPYLEAEISIKGLTLIPGLRADYFSQVKEHWSVDPRIVARYDFNRWAVKGGAALVHQAPDIPDLDEAFGNTELDLQRAYQYSLGGEWSPLDYIKADVTLFYKDMRNLVASSDRVVTRDGEQVPEKLSNEGRGRVFGAEVFLEHQFANNMRGWISYTLSRAERKDPGGDYRPFDYDQTHIFAAVGSYVLPRNWEVGFRWRYVSGNLRTPVVGSVFHNDRDSYTPIYGAVNSDRLPDFHQLDLRVDKTWVFDTWKISGYLSLINSYYRKNPEDVNYNYDYSEENYVTGLPILPILGVKGDW